jgi:hypothetical protein
MRLVTNVIALLRPIIDAQGGPVPNMAPWVIDLIRPLDETGAVKDGMAFFQIADKPKLSKAPVIMAIAAWGPVVQAEDAWLQVCQAYTPHHVLLQAKPAPSQMPALPWLAVWLTTCATGVDPQTMMAFGDLERCIAWTLIEPSEPS